MCTPGRFDVNVATRLMSDQTSDIIFHDETALHLHDTNLYVTHLWITKV